MPGCGNHSRLMQAGGDAAGGSPAFQVQERFAGEAGVRTGQGPGRGGQGGSGQSGGGQHQLS